MVFFKTLRNDGFFVKVWSRGGEVPLVSLWLYPPFPVSCSFRFSIALLHFLPPQTIGTVSGSRKKPIGQHNILWTDSRVQNSE